ncbi:MAG: 3-phosphoshikimate 1-carboxyvinyltransferase [Eubacterium sp.]|nr:3-phosphoshikimate 1-carboxyvinyltransferase [Eubacterium sp.]
MIMKKHSRPLKGQLQVPGDKSISHRSVMIGSLANGTTRTSGFLAGADCLSTISCFRNMGIDIALDGTTVTIHGKGLHGLQAPDGTLDCGNSGTTMRLLSGILAGQQFPVRLTGDASLQTRPMRRVIDPLSTMGADIRSESGNGCAPLLTAPAGLHGIRYASPVASAQVKSCVLLAGLYADGETSVTEPAISRNHTELMLQGFGAQLSASGTTVTVQPEPELTAADILIPGDISSAAYFIAAGLIVPDSEILLTNVGINPTRDGMLEVIRMMGGTIQTENRQISGGETSADLIIRQQSLHGCTIAGGLIPRLIDELPVIAVLAAYADGTTVIRDAQELKVKESNRIDLVVSMLRSMGAEIEATEDGMIIRGGKPLHGASIETNKDHRMAMSAAVASLAADGETDIKDAECVSISYPQFYEDLKKLQA